MAAKDEWRAYRTTAEFTKLGWQSRLEHPRELLSRVTARAVGEGFAILAYPLTRLAWTPDQIQSDMENAIKDLHSKFILP